MILRLALEPQRQLQSRLLQEVVGLRLSQQETRELLLEVLQTLQPSPEQQMRQALGLSTAPR